jgi:hypothetical protein
MTAMLANLAVLENKKKNPRAKRSRKKFKATTIVVPNDSEMRGRKG